jgi:adenylate cyclase
MSPKTTNIAIMFADISGSTRLFEVLGDATARVTVSDTLELLTKVIHQHSGTVIKTIGDEVMCTFPTADDSANAANEMQETLEDANEMRNEGPEIKIRVGMHYGPALLEGGDVFGDAVNVAARMAAQAKGGQIITTKSTVDLLEPIMRASTRFVDRAPIKGKKEDIEIFEIIWQEEDVTRMATGLMEDAPKIPQVSLQVSYGGNTITLDQGRSALVMGRSQACDLPINEKLASRQHVRIELRRNKFFIIDQSTNGTHVQLDNAEDAFLRREEMPISSNGAISLGKSFAESPTEVVAFTLQST